MTRTVREIERLTVYLPHALHREIRLAAAAAGQPVSAWLAHAATAAFEARKLRLRQEADIEAARAVGADI